MTPRDLFLTTAALLAGLSIGFGIRPSDNSMLQGSSQKPLTVAEFPDLVKGLKETPGIIDVKVAVLDGKKQTIFAWFKNKAAVDAWYNSPMHRAAMEKFFPHMPGNAHAMPHFKDEKSPVLVVASVTPSEKPQIEGSRLAVSQIAIEMYTPAAGGIVFGSGFGPAQLEVPGLRRFGTLSGN